MSYLCTCEGAGIRVRDKAKANRGSQTSKHCDNIQNTALKAVRPVPLPSLIVSLKQNAYEENQVVNSSEGVGNHRHHHHYHRRYNRRAVVHGLMAVESKV
mgnify:CR=1 FL=1